MHDLDPRRGGIVAGEAFGTIGLVNKPIWLRLISSPYAGSVYCNPVTEPMLQIFKELQSQLRE